MSKKQNHKHLDDSAYELLLAEEELILHAQMLIQRVLNDSGISQKKLADRLGVGESYVSQMLGTSARNLTLRTIARVMKALDVKATLVLDEYVEPTQTAEPTAPVESPAEAEALEQVSAAVASSVAGDEDAAKAVASKIAASQLSGVWGEVVELEPRRKSRRRPQRGDARAFASFDPVVQAFEPDVLDMALAA